MLTSPSLLAVKAEDLAISHRLNKMMTTFSESLKHDSVYNDAAARSKMAPALFTFRNFDESNSCDVTNWKKGVEALADRYTVERILSDDDQRLEFLLNVLFWYSVGPSEVRLKHGFVWLYALQLYAHAINVANLPEIYREGIDIEGGTEEQDDEEIGSIEEYIEDGEDKMDKENRESEEDEYEDNKSGNTTVPASKTSKNKKARQSKTRPAGRPTHTGSATQTRDSSSSIRFWLPRCLRCIKKKKPCSRVDGNGPGSTCRKARGNLACVAEPLQNAAPGKRPFYGRDKSNEPKRVKKNKKA